MFLHLSTDGRFELRQVDDFKSFKVKIDAERTSLNVVRDAISSAVRLADGDIAWISLARLRQMPDVCSDEGWQRAFDAMIDAARPHGWVDDNRGEVRAHIEWLDASPLLSGVRAASYS